MKELFNIGDILTLHPQSYTAQIHNLHKPEFLITSIDISTSIKLNCTGIDLNGNFIIDIAPGPPAQGTGEYYSYVIIRIYKLPDISYPCLSLYKDDKYEDDVIKVNELELNKSKLCDYMIEKLTGRIL